MSASQLERSRKRGLRSLTVSLVYALRLLSSPSHICKRARVINLRTDDRPTGLNVDLKRDQSANADSWQWPDDGSYFSGLEVFHSLHCLNRIRQAFYPEVYQGLFDNPDDPPRQHHIDHCINHLRQAIQCHSDLTPMQWLLDGDKVILNTNTRHTCRDFERVREWAATHQTNFTAHDSVLREGTLHFVD